MSALLNPFAALTATFTIASAALGYALHASPEFCVPVVAFMALMGGVAAAECRKVLE